MKQQMEEVIISSSGLLEVFEKEKDRFLRPLALVPYQHCCMRKKERKSVSCWHAIIIRT